MKKAGVIMTIFIIFAVGLFADTSKFAMPKVGYEEGNVIPDFNLVDLNGKKVSIKNYRGKAVMLNFWATWCPPCRGEMPSMEVLWNKSKDKKFVILAVSVDQKKTSDVVKFIKENEYTFPVFHDISGELSEMFLVRSIPTTYLLDGNGVIVSKESGARDWSDLDVDKLLAGKKGN